MLKKKQYIITLSDIFSQSQKDEFVVSENGKYRYFGFSQDAPKTFKTYKSALSASKRYQKKGLDCQVKALIGGVNHD